MDSTSVPTNSMAPKAGLLVPLSPWTRCSTRGASATSLYHGLLVWQAPQSAPRAPRNFWFLPVSLKAQKTPRAYHSPCVCPTLWILMKMPQSKMAAGCRFGFWSSISTAFFKELKGKAVVECSIMNTKWGTKININLSEKRFKMDHKT